MSGLPFLEAFAPASIRTTLACFESVEGEAGFAPFTGFDPADGDDPRVTPSRDNPCAPRQVSGERRTALTDLIGDTVATVEPHPGGALMRFRSGAAIVLSLETTCDAAGLLVIEP